MDTKSLDASNAYSTALKALENGLSGTNIQKSGGAVDGASAFGDLVTNALTQTTAAVSGSEAVTAKAVSGKADLVDVVTAVSNAELMVNTVVGVRDKVISAYQEVIKMPI